MSLNIPHIVLYDQGIDFMDNQESTFHYISGENNNQNLDEVEVNYDENSEDISESRLSSNDPILFVIDWFDLNLILCLSAYNNGEIINAPIPPSYLNPSNIQTFKSTIHAYLISLTRGGFGNIIGPSSIVEYSIVLAAFIRLEKDPFIQSLVAFVGSPLASCACVSGRTGYMKKINFPPPFYPFHQAFI